MYLAWPRSTFSTKYHWYLGTLVRNIRNLASLLTDPLPRLHKPLCVGDDSTYTYVHWQLVYVLLFQYEIFVQRDEHRAPKYWAAPKNSLTAAKAPSAVVASPGTCSLRAAGFSYKNASYLRRRKNDSCGAEETRMLLCYRLGRCCYYAAISLQC